MGVRSGHQFVRDKLPLLSCANLRAGEHRVLPSVNSIVGLNSPGCSSALLKKVASPTLIHKETAISLFCVKVSSLVGIARPELSTFTLVRLALSHRGYIYSQIRKQWDTEHSSPWA